jgi:hypothetical protein
VKEQGGERLYGARSERIFRARVLADVSADPAWYAGILARRLLATLTQWKLWPSAARTGATFAPRSAENEGLIDSYYGLVPTIDLLGLGSSRVEIPAAFFPGFLVVAALVAWRRPAARSDLAVPAALLLAALPVPLLISTAGALETQAAALPALLCAALAAEAGRW